MDRAIVKRGAALLLIGGLVVTLLVVMPRVRTPRPDPRPATFVRRASCVGCHRKEYEDWQGSDHDRAMDVATDKTVLGDFTQAPFFLRDGKFFVHTDGADGQERDYEITHVFGVEPLQQYLIPTEGGRLQTLQLSWDTTKKEWFLANDEFHWTDPQFTWNFMCAECHSTNLKRNYDEATRSYDTTWTEIDVSCQACHGPGSNHIEDPLEPYAIESEIDSCARCHARRVLVDGDYEHNRPFMDHYAPALLEDRLYFADGQIKEEVYVYGSFLQSQKHRRGVRCSDCHNVHSGRLKFEGNALCGQCHQPSPPDRFPTLQKKLYDLSGHHHHQGEIACVDCHMPARKYMVVDPRRDHSFRVPRPDLSVRFGTPNACRNCHEDKTDAWAAAAIEAWYPDSKHRGPHFAEALATNRGLRELALDKEQPAIARATAISRLPPLPSALQDEDPIVRAAAIAAFLGRPDKALLGPLLKDPIRAVRVQAARVLDTDLAEFIAQQKAQAERPEAHLNLGVMYANRGDTSSAEREYRIAVSLDPRFLPVRFNLANLYNTMHRNEDARAQLLVVLEQAPANGEAHYSMGLLLVEMNKPAEAEVFLAKAARVLRRGRVHYNHALLLLRLRRIEEAEAALLNAEKLAPRDRDILNALVSLYVNQRAWRKALPFAKRTGNAQLVARIRAQIAR